jgi:hypothetical protein
MGVRILRSPPLCMPAVGRGAPKCCRSCFGRRPATKPRGEDRAEALPIFTGPPSIDGVFWSDRRRNHHEDPAGEGGGGVVVSGALKCCRRGGGGAEWQKNSGETTGRKPCQFFTGPSILTHLNFTLTSLLSLPHPTPPYQHHALCLV